MSKNVIIIVFALLIVLMYSCKKDDFVPTVHISSIETNNEITRINLNINEVENEPTSFTGICYDFKENPNILTNQVLLDGKRNIIDVENLVPDSILYFKAFVSNNYGYNTSVDFKYTVPYNEAPEVPCTINNNSIVKNGVEFNISSATSFYNSQNELEKTLECSNNIKLKIVFKEKPVSGIYSTVNSFNNTQSSRIVKIYIYHSLLDIGWTNAISSDNGKLVYIDNNNMDSFKMSFCEITYNYEGIDYTIKGNHIEN